MMSSSTDMCIILLVVAWSLYFIFRLATTPLKSSIEVGGQSGNRDGNDVCGQSEFGYTPQVLLVKDTLDVGADLPTPKEGDDNSRSVGLGRSTRLQLVAVLDEFWEQLYDLHGQPRCEVSNTSLQSLRCCILKLLRVEGSDWLFRKNDGVDEDLIDRMAAMERWLHESGTSLKNDEVAMTNIPVSTTPHCGEGCIWTTDLIVSFGIWCIHRILDLSLMETRPELWGKYTYILNRLQGIIDPAFSERRTPMPPCRCLQLSAAHQQQRSSPPSSNSMLPPASEPGRDKCTDASTLLDLIKAVEIAISGRKGRMGTTAAKAFQKGKENLGSALKRYKRRLANKGK